MKKLLVVLLSLLVVASTPLTVFTYPEREFSFPKARPNTYAAPFGPPFVAEQDIVITKINWSITGTVTGSVYDFCVYFYRESDPYIPLVIANPSEAYCSTATRMGSGANWVQTLDLSDTPVYVLAGTHVYIAAVAFDVANPENLRFNTSIEYHEYETGEPAYQIVRFPHSDQLMDNVGGVYKIAKTYYQSSEPRYIGGLAFYHAYLSNYTTQNVSNICLRRLSIEGGLLSTACAPNQYFTPGVNSQNPTVVYPAGWTVGAGEFLTASCQSTKPSDCGIFAFVKIPDDEIGTPASMSNEKLINRRFLDIYCNIYAVNFFHSYYGTTPEEKVQACKELYP